MSTSEYLHHGHRLIEVYGNLDPATAQAIVGLWLGSRALSAAEAERRLKEVVYAVRDPGGELVGVNTVYVASRPDSGRSYYFYRSFIRADRRGVPGLARRLLQLAIDSLRLRAGGPDTGNAPVGLMVVAENPKLMRRGVAAIAREMGLHLVGKDRRGCAVWCLHFDGSEPPPTARQAMHT